MKNEERESVRRGKEEKNAQSRMSVSREVFTARDSARKAAPLGPGMLSAGQERKEGK